MNLKKIKAFLLENEEGQALLSELSVSAVDEAIKAKLESGELVAVGELSEESKALLGETFDSESVISLIEGAPDDALVSATAAKAALKRADEIAAENLKGEVKLVGDAHEISALSGGEIPASKVLETVKASKDADMALAQQRTAAENLKLKNTKARVEQTPEEALKADFDEMADKGYFGEIKDDEHRAKLFADFRKRRAKG